VAFSFAVVDGVEVTVPDDVIVVANDVCLKAEASPRGSLEAAKVLPWLRLDVLMPCLDLEVLTSVSSLLTL